MEPLSYTVEFPRERITWIDIDDQGVTGSTSDDFKLPYRLTLTRSEFNRVFGIGLDETSCMHNYEVIEAWLVHNDMWIEYGETNCLYELNTVLVFGGGNGPEGRYEIRPNREWTLAFENEDHAVAFKLRWF
ncbi:MAG: hypothetical protein EOP83_33190 [Verrucomicrobiaceae bacterium]|nr:MAG: hypothetical protein EOP83_33190 [Verrucomicrobiaceae bacterium]